MKQVFKVVMGICGSKHLNSQRQPYLASPKCAMMTAQTRKTMSSILTVIFLGICSARLGLNKIAFITTRIMSGYWAVLARICLFQQGLALQNVLNRAAVQICLTRASFAPSRIMLSFSNSARQQISSTALAGPAVSTSISS